MSAAINTTNNQPTVKVTLNGDTRRFSVATYERLVDSVRSTFALPADAALLFKYTDDDGDLVSLSSASELTEAMRIAQSASHVASLTVLFSDAKSAAAPATSKLATLNVSAPSITTQSTDAAVAPATATAASSAALPVVESIAKSEAKAADKEGRRHALKGRSRVRMQELKCARAGQLAQVNALEPIIRRNHRHGQRKGKAESSSDEEAHSDAVPENEFVRYQHQLGSLAEMNFTNLRLNVRLLSKHNGELEPVVERLTARKAKIAAKCIAHPELSAEKEARKAAKAQAKAQRIAAKAANKSEEPEAVTAKKGKGCKAARKH